MSDCSVSGLIDRDPATVQAHDPQRARDLLMLIFESRSDFDDPSIEYRWLFSELLGTFLLVLVAAGGHPRRVRGARR